MLLAHNKMAFDKGEVKYARSALNHHNMSSFPKYDEIPDSEIAHYFEGEKRAILTKLKKEDKTRLKKEEDKLKEQEEIKKIKEEKLISEDDSNDKETNKKKQNRDRVLNVMYNNPTVFKVTPIMRALGKLKRERVDTEYGESKMGSVDTRKLDGESNRMLAQNVSLSNK